MKKPRYTDQQIAQALRQAEQGPAVADLTLDKAMLQDARDGQAAGGGASGPTRRACHVVQCNRETFYYRSQRRDLTPLRMRLRELAAARPRFGYRRLHILLRRRAGRSITSRRIGCTATNSSACACVAGGNGPVSSGCARPCPPARMSAGVWISWRIGWKTAAASGS